MSIIISVLVLLGLLLLLRWWLLRLIFGDND